MGEKFIFDKQTQKRKVANCNKTLAKLLVSGRQQNFTFRTLAAFLSLLLYSMHTLSLNPAQAFFLMRLYRGIGVATSKNGGNWDDKVPFICTRAKQEIDRVLKILLSNTPVSIPPPLICSYEESMYDEIIFVDASKDGWGAVRKRKNLPTLAYQQKFIHFLSDETQQTQDPSLLFTAQFSAHAEPTAVRRLLQHLLSREHVFKHQKIAVVSDHVAIARAQKKENGFGGIGRGLELNSLFFVANPLNVCFFYVAGGLNPADVYSRTFDAELIEGRIYEQEVSVCTPLLQDCFSPLCISEEETRPAWMR